MEAQPHPVRARVLRVLPAYRLAVVRLGFPFNRTTMFYPDRGGRMVESEAARGVPLVPGVKDELVPLDSTEAAERSLRLDASLMKFTRENDALWIGATVQTIAT
jgi:hypothetical protein